MARDLREGTPIKVIISFALPIMLGSIFQQVYSMIDSIIVGKFVGVEALAGVGSTGSLNWLVIGFLIGTGTGFAIPISQRYGARDYTEMRKYYTNAMYIGVVLVIVVTTLSLIFVSSILNLMQTPDDMYEYAKTYAQTIFIGIPGAFLYNYLSSVLRGIGDSKTPLYFLIGSSLVNVILDLIFVIVFDWGVFGAGFATVISQTLAGILCMFLITKKFDILKTERSDWKFSLSHIKTSCFIGFPMGLQYSITAIGGVILQSFVNTLGSVYVAAVTASNKINVVICQGLEALGLSMATYTGQNLGAGKISRISKGVKQCLIVGAVYSVIIFVLMLFTADKLALLFVSADDVEIISSIRNFLLINTGSYLLLAILLVFRNTIQGLGYSIFAMIAGVTEMFARALCGIFIVSNFGFIGAMLSGPVAWLFACLFLTPAYFSVFKKIKETYISR